MNAVVQKSDGKCSLGGFGRTCFYAKHRGRIAKVEDRLSNTVKHQADAHAGTDEHRVPGEVAEFGSGLDAADAYLAVFAERKEDNGGNKDVCRSDVEPAKV